MRSGRVWLTAAAVAVVGVLALAGSVLAGTPALSLEAGISAIAADRGRVAVTVRGTRTACDSILVWTPSTGRTRRVEASTNCPGSQSLRERIREVALAGRRVPWIEEATGNLQSLTLRVRRLDRPKTLDLSFAENHDGAEGLPDGRYVGYLEGDGAELGRIDLERGRVAGIGLWGGSVVLLRASRLEEYSIATGELVKTLPAPPGSRLTDVDGDLAALASRSSVTVVRLSDGASRTFRLAGARVAGADLEPAGLFHAWSLAPGGRVFFVPREQIVQAASRPQSP